MMKKQILTSATALGISLIGAIAAISPAAAQDQVSTGTERVQQVIVYDKADCPAESADTITSCIVVTGESPYRIPKNLRSDPNARQNISQTRTAEGDLRRAQGGFGSCDATLAGSSNCSLQQYDQYRAERQQRETKRYGRLIEIERQRRLGLIDDEAAEQEKKEIMEEESRDAASAAPVPVTPAATTMSSDTPSSSSSRDLTLPPPE